MSSKDLNKLILRFHGWKEEGVIRFPSVYMKEQFEKAYDAAKA